LQGDSEEDQPDGYIDPSGKPAPIQPGGWGDIPSVNMKKRPGDVQESDHRRVAKRGKLIPED